MDSGGLSLLTRCPASVGGLYSAAPAAAAPGGELNRQAVAQNLLVLLHEVEGRLREEMAAVAGFSSKLQEAHAALPDPASGHGGHGGGRRPVRSIWSHASDCLGVDAVVVAGAGCAPPPSVQLQRTLSPASGTSPSASGAALRPGSGCGDWCEATAALATAATLSPGPGPITGRNQNTKAGGGGRVCEGLEEAALGVRPSWLSGGPGSASSYRYFLGRAGGGAGGPPDRLSGPPPPPPTSPSSWQPRHPGSVAAAQPARRAAAAVACPEYRLAQARQARALQQARAAQPCVLQEVLRSERLLQGCSVPSELQLQLPQPDGGRDQGGGGGGWLVDAVHLLKEYYLKRAQLCMRTQLAACCHALAEPEQPERDVCRRDVGVGGGLVSTADRSTSAGAGWAGRVDAATSPRPSPGGTPGRTTRTTQTPPVLCQPVYKTGDFHWLATDAIHPDLTVYVSCFDEPERRA